MIQQSAVSFWGLKREAEKGAEEGRGYYWRHEDWGS